jgi:hypothetical protein
MQIPFHTSKGTVDLAALQPGDFGAPMIAGALAKINRFTGQTRRPWSVAAHSLLVEALCPTQALKGWALLHDAHEAFIGDITTPAFEFIRASGSGVAVANAVHNAKGRLDRAIGAAWSCVPQPMSLEIRRADWIALQTERCVFFNEPLTSLQEEDRVAAEMAMRTLKILFCGSDWAWSRDQWLKRAHQLEKAGLLTLPGFATPSSTSLAG